MTARKPPVVDDETGFRLASFADGEGHFAIVRSRKVTTRTWVYGCAFIAQLRDDDEEWLARLRALTGLGGFTRSGKRNLRGGWHSKPQIRWAIQTKAECLRLVEMFDKYPLWSKKARDFAIWRQAVRYWCGPKPEGNAPLERWFHEIRAIREYAPGDLIEPEDIELAEPLFDLERV